MAKLIFRNNAQSTLAGSISATATSLNVAAGTGILFAVPAAGQYWVGTLIDAATGLLDEIIWVTAVVGDTLTIVRGQEGTTPKTWAANDLIAELWTAGQCATMLQNGDEQSGASTFGVDTGIANAYRCVLNPVLTANVQGMAVRLLIANTNTGPSTFDPGTGAAPIVRSDGSAFIGGEMIAGDAPWLTWTGTQWRKDNAAPATAAALAAGTDAYSFITPHQFAAAVTSVSTGMIVPFAGSPTHFPASGFLLCDGSQVSRSAQANLFTVIGTTWGVGDGSTTFNLPNLVGRVLAGVDTAGTVMGAAFALGQEVGEAKHQLTVPEMPSHTHAYVGLNNVNNAASGGGAPGVNNPGTTSPTGGDLPHNNLQPSAGIYWLIKT
jgi:microcystin-dependent protein